MINEEQMKKLKESLLEAIEQGEIVACDIQYGYRQVPNPETGQYWEAHPTGFTYTIILKEQIKS